MCDANRRCDRFSIFRSLSNAGLSNTSSARTFMDDISARLIQWFSPDSQTGATPSCTTTYLYSMRNGTSEPTVSIVKCSVHRSSGFHFMALICDTVLVFQLPNHGVEPERHNRCPNSRCLHTSKSISMCTGITLWRFCPSIILAEEEEVCNGTKSNEFVVVAEDELPSAFSASETCLRSDSDMALPTSADELKLGTKSGMDENDMSGVVMVPASEPSSLSLSSLRDHVTRREE
mmetsp:Transcript_7822/g.13829  ORF Transcript_7822/g.13829 Transcript_7822/m.13829 type:complete len:233 (+) Transcript_7822:1651-2349(+)